MSAVIQAREANLAISAPAEYSFTVDQYHRMIEMELFQPTDRFELVEGRIFNKMTKKPPHDAAISLAQDEIGTRLPEGWMLRIQSAITTGDSEPEPDVAVVKKPGRRYVKAHPRPADIGLLVEVADSTLVFDQTKKKRAYARANIPVYWIVNLIDRRIEVYSDPRGGRNPTYRRYEEFGPADRVPLVIDGKQIGSIAVADLLP
jgi:Uma2 family endonuclease